MMDHSTPLLDLPPFAAESADIDGLLDDLVESPAAGRYVTFELGSKRFCISASSIAEITSPLTFTFLPNSPASVAGLAPFRGEALAIIGLRELLQTGEAEPNSRPKFLVLREGGMATRLAFEIDRMLDVVDGRDCHLSEETDDGVVNAQLTLNDGRICGRIDAARLYSLLSP